MKKSLIAMGAALACLGTAHAESSVQLMGLMDAYAGSVRMAGDADRTSVVGSGGLTTSWFGFKGTEDLGGGLKAGFLLTSFLRVDTGSPGRFNPDPFFSRDASVSLSGGFGSVALGRGMAPNFLPTILLNPFGDSFTVSPLVLHANVPLFNGTGWGSTTPSDTGWSNQITYTTPSFGGLKANLHYQFGEQAGNSGKSNIGLNVMYFGGPLTLMGFYERADISNPVPPNSLMNRKSDWMLGGAYDFGMAKAYLTYGQAKVDATDFTGKTFSLGAEVPVLNKAGAIKAAMARTKATTGPGEATRTTASLGYDHFLSKRTDVYAVGMYDKVTDLSSGTSFVVGIRHRF